MVELFFDASIIAICQFKYLSIKYLSMKYLSMKYLSMKYLSIKYLSIKYLSIIAICQFALAMSHWLNQNWEPKFYLQSCQNFG